MAAAALGAEIRASKLADLREMLARRGVLVSAGAVPQADPRRGEESLSTGLAELDAVLPGGFPRRALSEILGAEACGKTSLVLPALGAATKSGALVAIVDPGGEMYPPALASRGIDLARLLCVRPPAPDGEPMHALWAAEVLLSSGAFEAVLLDTQTLAMRKRVVDERRAMVLRSAAETHGAAFLVTGSVPLGAPPAIRLAVTAQHVTVEKSRYGWVGQKLKIGVGPQSLVFAERA